MNWGSLLVFLPLIIPPAYIGIVSVVERRWGQTWSGRLTAVPTQTTTVILIVGFTDGSSAAAGVAAGAILGVISLSVFAAGYGATSSKGAWWVALPVAVGVFFLTGATLIRVHGSAVADGLAAIVTIAAVLAVLASLRLPPSHKPVRRFPVVVRMLFATLLVAGVTLLVPVWGPVAAGTLGVFPIITAPMTVFNQAESGPDASRRYLMGLEWGLPGGVAWFLALSLLLGRYGVLEAFLVGLPGLVAVLLGCFALADRLGHTVPHVA